MIGGPGAVRPADGLNRAPSETVVFVAYTSAPPDDTLTARTHVHGS